MSETTVEDWLKRLPSLVGDYAIEDVFNADETGLMFRALPSRSLVTNTESKKGIKVPKERVTVLLACSAAGEKLTPLLIGKNKEPRCLKGIPRGLLPIDYRWNAKAWMTSGLFKEWVQRVNSKMRLCGRSILLFVDNCPAHPPLEMTNVKVIFFPPNTTARLQPCDAGVIANFKTGYRKRLRAESKPAGEEGRPLQRHSMDGTGMGRRQSRHHHPLLQQMRHPCQGCTEQPRRSGGRGGARSRR